MRAKSALATVMPTAVACVIFAVGSTGCQGKPMFPAWLGGQGDCALDGPVVEHPDFPAVPLVLLTPLKHAVYHVLPEMGTRVRMRLRVDEDGSVTGGCPVGTVDPDLVKALVRYAVAPQDHGSDRYPSPPAKPPFVPARANGRNVPSAVVVEFSWEAPSKEDFGPTNWKTRSSTEVKTLEAQALAPHSVEPRLDPGAAYARLGELGTRQARQAVFRIEEAAKNAKTSDPSMPNSLFNPSVIASTTAADGTEFRVTNHSRFNGAAFALAWRGGRNLAWGREYLLPTVPSPHIPSQPASRLRWVDRQRLEFSFTDLEPWRHDLPVPWKFRPKAIRRHVTIVVPDLTRDSDGDGWTDVEEERMFLNPSNPDSDGDGLPDGRDVCPNHASAPGWARGEEDLILQKAILAVLGLPGRSGVRFRLAGPEARRVSLVGWAGPVIYGHATESHMQAWARGAEWVSWRIARKTPTEAAVEVERSSGGSSGAGYEVFLRKRDGIWWVVLQDMTWIS